MKKLTDLRLSANLLECKVRSNGDMDLNGNKLYALFDNDTGKRVTPFYSLVEWDKLNEVSVMFNFLNK